MASFGITFKSCRWIYTVARNIVLESLRKKRNEDERFQAMHLDQQNTTIRKTSDDDLVRMLLLCCNPQISVKAQIYLTLKAVCGFSLKEIARATSQAEETIKKSITRAKTKISSMPGVFNEINPSKVNKRFNALIDTIYTLFNEGYAASSGEQQLRKNLAEEAIYLCNTFLKSKLTPVQKVPQLQALMALMLLQFARFESRTDEANQPILMQAQNRKKWSKNLIAAGLQALKESQKTKQLSSLHIEARIAAEHSTSISFNKTNWPQILKLYDQLITLKDSSEVRLNRIIALWHVEGSKRALQELENLSQIKTHSRALAYLIHSVYAQLLHESGDMKSSLSHWQQAHEMAPTQTDKNFTEKKLKKF